MYHYYFFQDSDFVIHEFCSENEITREDAYDLYFNDKAQAEFQTYSSTTKISAVCYAYILLLGKSLDFKSKYKRLEELEQMYVEIASEESTMSKIVSIFEMSMMIIEEQGIDILSLYENPKEEEPTENENISDN